jgi:hypothetical protein
MANPIPKILNTGSLQSVIDMSVPYPELYFSGLYPQEQDYPSDRIKWLMYNESPDMAPITARGSKASVWSGGDVSEVEQGAMLIQQKIQHSEADVNKLLELKAANPKKADAFEKLFIKKEEGAVKRIFYRKEHMAAMIGCNAGVYEYTDDKGNSFIIDYNLPASHKVSLTGNDVWGDGSSRTPLVDVYNHKEKIETDSGGVVTAVLMNSWTFRNRVAGDTALRDMVIENRNNNFNVDSEPVKAYSALFDVPFRKYDVKRPIHTELTTTINGGVFGVRSAIGLTAGTTVKFCKGTSEGAKVEEEEVIASIDGDTITLVAAPTGSFVPGRDSIKANVPFLRNDRLVFWVKSVQGEDLIQWYNAPIGNPTQYGLNGKAWMEDELEDTFQRVRLFGLWALTNNQAIGILDVH